ncbi:tRNA(adenine34) deaminase [Thermoflavifilum aggregans]|uniref:tRNA-specific adenosine deaminase n=1 Tax=Thermoflavifilum aggregans TaxID=454188 RepID=A0A2M9CS31_9BACT|nr:nucleoside deaminase [Thermoflavifilum aggregans]MBX6380784.1 nucleoside deaminase [Thermoflavifilum aggregans]PJJ74756.1 tRNA(adenine34) deaminase [Thermoflavifilum aggregans]
MSSPEADQQFMREALKEAQKAYEAGEVPVGAVLVIDGQIIARAHNQVELLNDSTAHAEMLALTAAFHALGSKYLPQATLYVTLEPCLMCTGALYWSQIGRVVFATADEKNGFRIHQQRAHPFHPKTLVQGGLLAEESARLLKNFFAERRL